MTSSWASIFNVQLEDTFVDKMLKFIFLAKQLPLVSWSQKQLQQKQCDHLQYFKT